MALTVGAVITLIGAALFQFFMNTVIDEARLEKYAGAARRRNRPQASHGPRRRKGDDPLSGTLP